MQIRLFCGLENSGGDQSADFKPAMDRKRRELVVSVMS